MPPKKKKKLVKCPKCACSIKGENLDKHILMVHEIGSTVNRTSGVMRSNKVEDRKKLEFEQNKKKMNMVFLGILICLVVVVTYFFVLPGSETKNPYTNFDPIENVDEIDTGEVKISKAEITTEPTFYVYNTDGVTISYFAVKGSDGKVHVAFDACDVCWEYYMGYRKSGTDMECNYCGDRFSINSIGTENLGDGCWPSHLHTREDDWYVYIDPQDIAEKIYMF